MNKRLLLSVLFISVLGLNLSAQVITVIGNFYRPSYMSSNGQHVCGVNFGGAGGAYYWSSASGLLSVSDQPQGVANNGIVVGTIENPGMLYNGNPVECAATWDPATLQWTFLGLHPTITPQPHSNTHSSGWAINGDATKVFGMVWPTPGYTWAFSWDAATSYTTLNANTLKSARPNDCSDGGELAAGWVQTTQRTPALWVNGVEFVPDPTAAGEFWACSPDGSMAVASLNAYYQFEIWHSNGYIQITPIAGNQYIPLGISNKGMVVGTTNTFPPTSRVGFVWDSINGFRDFGTFASQYGFNATGWYFYSVHALTPGENRFLVSGRDPSMTDQTFLFDIATGTDGPAIMANTLSISPVPAGDRITVNYTLGSAAVIDFGIYNLSGRLVKTELSGFQSGSGEHALNVDISALPAGMYFCRLQTTEGVLVEKIVKP